MSIRWRWFDAATWAVAWVLLVPLVWELARQVAAFVADVWAPGR